MTNNDAPPRFDEEMKAEDFAAWRRAVGLSFPWAAHHLGVSSRQASRYEAGLSPIKRPIAILCASLYERAVVKGETIEGQGTFRKSGRPWPKKNKR